MAGQRDRWRTQLLLIIFSLLRLTKQFVVKEDEWEELRPDIASLHRLNGLSERIFHERLKNPSETREATYSQSRIRRSVDWLDVHQIPTRLLDGFKECEKFTSCVMENQQDLDDLLAHIENQKTDDWLLSASEISHSYSLKLLVMTDKEKSTNDRVRQEYSMDPEYSVIVSEECLYNASCVPEVDSNTVVKVFGSVSEDGQTVSGLSGSSLANLIRKSGLEAAAVFSLDGNTTTEFHHNFIRVFMLRGLKAALETNLENQQIYQVMDQPDSVSSYRIPQRAADHSAQYDHQQIIMLQDDEVVRKAATYLYEKHPEVSSVYVLDNNQRPKLINGKSGPLSENSRLVLVGHGAGDASGETRLSGYRARDVARIIQSTSRVSGKIKTISVVGCEVGKDKLFVETLAKEVYLAGIETELHLRNSLVQVKHTGEKITTEITPDGLKWRHKDDSKKVVATIDRNGDVIIRNEPGSKGEAVFTDERNLLVGGKKKGDKEPLVNDEHSLPREPKQFISPDIFTNIEEKYKSSVDKMKTACKELESISWGVFHSDKAPEKISEQRLKEIENDGFIGKRDNNCFSEGGNPHTIYEIKSGEDIRNIILHFAKNIENNPTYLMVNDWIFSVAHKNLYVYPVGNTFDNKDNMGEVKRWITQQNKEGNERYENIQKQMKKNDRKEYVFYIRDIFHGEQRVNQKAPSRSELMFAWYFTTSVIAESARNFRTFPLTLMAMDLVDRGQIPEALEFLFDQHSMARGGSWIDQNKRGFGGSAAPGDLIEGMSKADKTKLLEVIARETVMFTKWKETLSNGDTVSGRVEEIITEYKLSEDTSEFRRNYEKFQEATAENLNIVKLSGEQSAASGALGGWDDGHVTQHDLNSATELENSIKHESYFSRSAASFSEEILTKLKENFGEDLAELRLQEGTAKIENGQFECQFKSNRAEAESVEFRVELSPESLHYYEKMLKNIDTAAHDMEMHSSASSHEVNKYVEHAGTAVGTLGLMLGLKGAVRAFEQGDIEDGMVATSQTAHGVTSIIAGKVLSSEGRVTKAASAIMKSPAMRGTMKVLPVVGIGFGIYSFAADLKRKDTLGYIDAALDGAMVVLDVIELAQPELAPIILPITLALSVVRMAVDDIYMGIQNELTSLPKDAGVLDKVTAVFLGIGKGIMHFYIHVASFFYDWHCDEIQEGRRLVAQISDYHKYYTYTKEEGGGAAIDFTGGSSSWNGGGINFCLADQGPSQLCMDYFVSSDESFGKRCWTIDTHESPDIILGLGESHALEHKTLQKKVLLFIPAGSVTVVSVYEAVSSSRYGTYKGNRDSNRFFAVQTAEDKHVIEVMLSYYYRLYGEPGDDIFYLGPQRSYVEGSGGKDTYMIPENGGKTIINNYDPSKALDTLHFSVDYSHISVTKSGNDVVLMYESSHTVTIQSWFSGELYRHMSMVSGDGVLFEISSTVVSSVQLVARGINKMFKTRGETVDASQPLLQAVTNILGTPYDDVIVGNGGNNLMDGGGGRDRLIGGEGEDIYMVKDRKNSSVLIENDSRDSKTDLVIIEANLHTFEVRVEGDDVTLKAHHGNTPIQVTLVNWFRSPADRHLLLVTKDLITFTVSNKKADCRQRNAFTKCIESRSIDYSSSSSPLIKDLQEDEALRSVTEVRGSRFDDVIKGNKEHNVFISGSGNDFMEGRGGEDWYVITAGQGVKTINNHSPDLSSDIVFLKERYETITCFCEGHSIIISVHDRKTLILQNWFESKNHQHLQIKTSDGITAGLKTNISSCGESLLLPVTVDYRNQKPEPLQQWALTTLTPSSSFYRLRNSVYIFLDSQKGKVILMDETDSVKEMYGSSGFDVIIGNNNDNLLDPYKGGGLMFGGDGKDTYIIKHGYGNNLLIDNFAEDQRVDTVLVDMDFIAGSQIVLDSSTEDLNVTILTKEEEIKFSLLSYNDGDRHQHLEFQSSDGVHFKLKSLNSSGDGRPFQTEAFKVTLKQSQVDCRLDLSSQRNLSKVQTVQGCPSLSNDILGNSKDNALIGGWKDDALVGGEGDDTLIGGHGDDILIGGTGDDTLYGEDGNDTLMGDSGRDVFIPGLGADLVDGGPGRDAVLYRGGHEKGEGVYVNLLSGQGHYADAEGDVLKDVEMVIGTIYPDILVSGYESSLLKGSDGNDILVSTGGDYLVGGDGNDIYMLAFNHGSTTIDNCSKDNSTDVLYLNSNLSALFDCRLLSDRVLLTFFGSEQTAVNVGLRGWISNDHECGHLVVMFRDVGVSVDGLLQECELRLIQAVWSMVIML
ncbi:uncharacterized protein PAE49_006497 [Odontesthes bonariensis]|uniref:uncharacterized protein LOC142381819 n=1 Tax=Odontesthes bonariensis TaxID=219752 RepID=UPI003F584D9B